ncbi:MAG: hypothetical protein KME55_32500 [Nostoc indistinguendum CM1-VF10]|nr:hypothetical protein [Nostoc indistinguendum CM1-VF10]
MPKTEIRITSNDTTKYLCKSSTAYLLTVVQACRRQGRSVIDFFAQALLANSNSYLSRPSLLPKY